MREVEEIGGQVRLSALESRTTVTGIKDMEASKASLGDIKVTRQKAGRL